MSRTASIIGLVAAVLISQLAGIVGGLFTSASVATWYTHIKKPPFNPPSWVFAPVWTILFTLMGVAAWIVWRYGTDRRLVHTALTVFFVQLVLNTLWSIVFFGLHAPGYALLELVILWLAILATIILFSRISVAAGALLVPYLLWVSFAGVLNYYIWRLNA